MTRPTSATQTSWSAWCRPATWRRWTASHAASDSACWRFARHRCKNEEDAHDAVQDTLLSAGLHLRSFRGDGSLEGWLVRMVANACHRLRRGRKNDPTLHTTEATLESGRESPEQAAARAELGNTLELLLMQLSAQDRAILILAEGEGWTGPEIAAEMGMSAGAVRVRLTRVRQRLRRSLEPRGVGVQGRSDRVTTRRSTR